VPIDSWQLWEHHKHEVDRSASRNRRSSSRCKFFLIQKTKITTENFLFFFCLSACSCSSNDSNSSSSRSSSSSSCSSCHHTRRTRRRRLASIASIPNIHQQQTFPEPDVQSFSTNTAPTTMSIQQTPQSPSVDPYAPAPNLIRVERIKDVNSGQDVFIRWVSEANTSTTIDDDHQQQLSPPQQAYSSQPPRTYRHEQQSFDQDLSNDIEHLVFEDEHLRKSLLFDERPKSITSNYDYKRYKKHSKRRDLDSQPLDYEVVNGFFEDRHGRRRSVKLDHSQVTTVKDYRHRHNESVDASAPSNDQRRHRHHPTSFIQQPVPEQQQQQQQQPLRFPTPNYSLTNPQLLRPFGSTYPLPRGAPFYPQQALSSAPLFPAANFMNRMPFSHPSYWYRPM